MNNCGLAGFLVGCYKITQVLYCDDNFFSRYGCFFFWEYIVVGFLYLKIRISQWQFFLLETLLTQTIRWSDWKMSQILSWIGLSTSLLCISFQELLRRFKLVRPNCEDGFRQTLIISKLKSVESWSESWSRSENSVNFVFQRRQYWHCFESNNSDLNVYILTLNCENVV